MTTLIIDGHNFMHRARSGFQLGDFNVVFNLFRSLKPIVDQFEPGRVIFTLEGHPKRRYELLPTYKANRHVIIEPGVPLSEKVEKKLKSDEDFFRQKDIIVNTLSRYFPISLMRHPDHEADDLIYNVVANAARSSEFVIVSTDTDFIQMLQEFPFCRLYNPVSKKFVEAPQYDYVQWKALRGDGSDNVVGLAGVGDKTAESLLEDPDELKKLFSDPIMAEQFERNVSLINLMRWTLDEAMLVESSSPTRDWDAVTKLFEEWAFKSMLKEPYLTNFKATFDRLWNV